MKALRSALYAGTVMHQRLRPRRHHLSYGVFYLLLDLDEIETLARSSWLFRLGRLGLFSFNAPDHGDGSDTPLKLQVAEHLRAAGIVPDGGPIRLLTLPRILGYAFNPISVYFCHRRDGALAAVLYEVTNTFGDRHSYLIPVDSTETPILQHSQKALHVSPFLDNDMHYNFRLIPPDERIDLAITGLDDEGPMIVATLEATRRPLTDGALLRVLLAYPLMTLKVIAAIHWEALRLWRKGLAVHPRPAPPSQPVTVGHPLRPATTTTTAARQEEHDVAA
jgi:DUF1365 family protein